MADVSSLRGIFENGNASWCYSYDDCLFNYVNSLLDWDASSYAIVSGTPRGLRCTRSPIPDPPHTHTPRLKIFRRGVCEGVGEFSDGACVEGVKPDYCTCGA